MKNFNIKHLLTLAVLLTALAACRHKETVTPEIPVAPPQRAGVYVLNQGNFGGSNGSLTYYDYTSHVTSADIFSLVNSKGLGDTPNDVKIYGSKMYIAVDISSQIQVLNAKTGKIIKTFDQKDGTNTREPRSIAFAKGKVFVSQYDGTVAVLDTATLNIEKYIPVGRNPEQMVVSNGKLYVANSGGLTYGNPDKTVSVIDLTTLTETKKITVLVDPVSIGADTYGNVYVLCLGDYSKAGAGAGLTVIDNATDVVKSQNTQIIGNYGTSISVDGDSAYFLTMDANFAIVPTVYNTKTQTIAKANFITDGTVIASPYNLAYDSLTGELFVSDAKDYKSNGTLFAFDKNGKKEYSVVTGISPGAIVFFNK